MTVDLCWLTQCFFKKTCTQISSAKTHFPQAGRCFGCQFSYIKWPCCPLGERRRPGADFRPFVPVMEWFHHQELKTRYIKLSMSKYVKTDSLQRELTKNHLNFTCWVHVASRNSFLVGYFFAPRRLTYWKRTRPVRWQPGFQPQKKHRCQHWICWLYCNSFF